MINIKFDSYWVDNKYYVRSKFPGEGYIQDINIYTGMVDKYEYFGEKSVSRTHKIEFLKKKGMLSEKWLCDLTIGKNYFIYSSLYKNSMKFTQRQSLGLE